MKDDPATTVAEDPLVQRVGAFRNQPDHAGFVALRGELRALGHGELLAELCSFWAARDPDPKTAAEAWSEAGEVLYVMGLIEPAIDRLRRAIELDPLAERAVDRLVEALSGRGDPASAVEVIEQELADRSPRAESRPKKGDPLVVRRSEQHRRAAKLWNDSLGRVDRALWHWQQAWRLEPHRTDALEEARNLYSSLGDDAMVAKLYRAELEVLGAGGSAERRARLHYELGKTAMRGKDFAAAVAELEEAVRLEPHSTQLRETLAEAHALSGTGPDAVRRASELYVELGRSRLERDDATGIQLLRRAVGVDPTSSSGTKALEQALYTARRWRDLDRLLEERLLATAERAQRSELLGRRAELLRGPLADPQALAAVLAELVALEGPRTAASQELRQLLAESQRHEALAQHLENEVAAMHEDAGVAPDELVRELLELAALYREHLNDRDRAAELLHQALTVAPGHEEALARYLDHFRERRDWRGLLDLCEFALDNARAAGAPAEELVHRLEEIAQLAELRLGDIPRAIDAWQRVAELAPSSSKVAEALRRLTARSKMWEQLVSTLEAEVASADDDRTRVEAMRRMAGTYRERQIEPRRAIEVYEQILANTPGDEAALKALTELYEREGDDAGLAQALRRQLEADAARHSAQLAATGRQLKPAEAAREWPVAKRAERLTAFRRLAQLCETRLADVDGVVFACSGVLELLPGDRDALERMERVLERAGDARLEQTLEYHCSVAASPAERTRLLRRLARLAQAAGDDALALDRWEQAVRVSPTDAEALSALAELYQRAERWALLAQVLERLDGGRPLPERGTAEAAVRVGELERYAEIVDARLHDAARAIKAWQRILELSPKHRAALTALAALYRAGGKWRELVAVLELEIPAAQVGDPERATAAALEQAELYQQRLGAPSEAIRVLELVIRDLNPNHLGAHQALRALHQTRGDFESSVRVAERELYLASEPAQKVALGLEIGAMCRDRLGNPTRALQAFERVLGLDEAHPAALAAVAELHSRLGRPREQVRALERLLAATTDRDERRDLLHRIAHLTAEQLGDPRGALRWWRSAHLEAPDAGSFTDVRRAAEQYGLWKELAEAHMEERARVGGADGAIDRAAFVHHSRELAQLVERRLGDRTRAIHVLAEALALTPRDPELLAEIERLATESDGKAQWKLLLDAYDLAAAHGKVAERVALLRRRARVLDEHLGDAKAAMSELMSAFAWDPDREELRHSLYEVGVRARAFAELVAVETALAERASTTPARLEAVRRKAQLIEEHQKDAPRAFRCHLVAFLLDPEEQTTTSHLWRLARVIGRYREADRSPKPEPAPAPVHGEQVLAEIDRVASAAAPAPRFARMLTEELSETELGSLTSIDASAHSSATLRVGDSTQPLDLNEMELSETEVRSRSELTATLGGQTRTAIDTTAAPPERADRAERAADRTMELTLGDLAPAGRAAAPASPAASSIFAKAPPPRPQAASTAVPSLFSAAAASASGAVSAAANPAATPSTPAEPARTSPPPVPSKLPPPPPRAPQIRPASGVAAASPPRKAQVSVRKAPLPSVPAGTFESPWEELALAYEGLPAAEPSLALRWLTRAAEIWETGAAEIERAFSTLARAFEESTRLRREGQAGADAEVRARLHRVAHDHGQWDRLASLYEAMAERAESVGEAVELLIEVAKLRAEQRRPRDAEALLRRVLGIRPEDADARQRLEALYRQEARWVELAASLEERTDPRLGTAAPEAERVVLLRELASLYMERLTRPHDAIDTLERLRALSPADTVVLTQLAERFGEVGRWSKAIEMLARVVEVSEDPSEAREALRRVAAIYERELELPERAIDSYRQLVASWPDDAEAWAQLDTLYTQNARWSDLADALRRRAGLAREPKDRAALLSRRAQILLEWLDSAEEAAAALRHARTLTPEDPQLAEQLVAALVRADRGREAVAILESRLDALVDAGAASGERAALHLRVAQLRLERLADVDGARTALDAALELVPEHPTALALYAQLSSPEDDPRAFAEAKLREADATRDDDVRVEALMAAGAVLRDRVEDVDGARSAFERVLALRPYHSEGTWALAGLVEKGGDPEAAARLLEARLGTSELPVAEKARILTQLAALSRAAGVEPAAERRLLEALAAVPEHLPAIVALADFYADRERWDDLEAFLREVLEGELLNEAPPALVADLQRRLAQVFERLGRDEEAYQTLLAADRLHRGHLLVKLALGENRYKARRWREAALHLAPLGAHEDAARYPQEVAQGLYHAALAEIRSLRPEKAPPLYLRALELKPNFAPALAALAELAMEQGDHRQASDLLTRQAQSTDDPAEKLRLYEALGDMALMMMNDRERARACFGAAVTAAAPLEARHVPLLEKLLACQEALGDIGGAARTAELWAAFGASGGERCTRYLRAARGYKARGEQARARAAAERAVDADPYELQAAELASELALAADDLDTAAELLGRALSSKDDSQPTLRAALSARLGAARLLRGDSKRARQALERAIALAPDSEGATAARRSLVELMRREEKEEKEEKEERDDDSRELARAARRHAVTDCLRAVAHATGAIADLVEWAGELRRADAGDLGREALEVAIGAGHSPDVHQSAFLSVHRLPAMRADEPYRATLRAADQPMVGSAHPLGALALALFEAAPQLWPEASEVLARAELTPQHRVPATSHADAVAMWPRLTTAIGTGASVLYQREDPGGPDVEVLCGATVVVVLGPRLFGPQAPPPAELRAILARAAALTRPEHLVLAGLPAPELARLVAACARLFGPPALRAAAQRFVVDADVQRAYEDMVRSALSVKSRARIEEALASPALTEIDLAGAIAASQRAADCTALALATELTAVARLVAARGEGIAHLIRALANPAWPAMRTRLRTGK